jgi:hypothetical protein
MSRLIENKFVFAAVFVLFALACASNAIQGAGVPVHSHWTLAEPVTIANGPILDPYPWDGNVMIANGPILDPYPWDGNVMIANGPILDPYPWDGNSSVTA